MARKRSAWAHWGTILGVLAGAFYIVVGVLTILGTIAQGILDVFYTASWLNRIGGGLEALILGIIMIVLGVLIVLLCIGRFGLNYVVIGILLIIFAIIGSGLPAILALIAGIFFIIAGA
jgi:hypothetical protein